MKPIVTSTFDFPALIQKAGVIAERASKVVLMTGPFHYGVNDRFHRKILEGTLCPTQRTFSKGDQ